jgi:hypothetical protein
MKIIIASIFIPLLAIAACSKTSATLSEAQVKATLEDCFSPHHRNVNVGPIVPKGTNENEVNFKYTVGDEIFPGTASFMQDQTGKRYMTSVLISHEDCRPRLPLAVK